MFALLVLAYTLRWKEVWAITRPEVGQVSSGRPSPPEGQFMNKRLATVLVAAGLIASSELNVAWSDNDKASSWRTDRGCA